MAPTTSLPWDVEKRLQQILENVSLTLLYKSDIRKNSIDEIFNKCTDQGPTVTVLYCHDHILGFLMPNNFWTDNRNIALSTTLFFSFKCNKDMEMSIEILNIKQIEVDKDKLVFHSFDNEVLIIFNPSKKKYFLCPSLSVKIFKKCLYESKYCECEVFRVEDIKVKNGYISKIARATKHRHHLLEELINYKVYGNLFSEIRILLLGPVGSGKSSFFNSVKSIFQGHMTRQAPVGSDPVGSDIRSITEQYRIYSIKNGTNGKSLPFMLCDSMGLHDTNEAGLCIEDIPYILKGNIPDRYTFNPCKPITPQHPTFITSPSLKDRIHCVAYVFDINSIINLSSKMMATFKKIQREVLNHGIPLMILITKVENHSDILQDNLLNMNELSEEKVIKLTKTLNIPSFTILMVQNYASELELYPLKDIVILTALRQMLRAANAALEDLPLEKPV